MWKSPFIITSKSQPSLGQFKSWKKRIVEVIPGKDRREKIIKLTDLGDEMYQLGRQKITELELSVMEGISLEEQKATYQILPKIRENILQIKGESNE